MVRQLALALALLGALLCAPRLSHALLAFPTAGGWGAEATGGRGGVVCKVTTLANTGAGSLRNCLADTGPRTIVFTVSGVITLTSGCSAGNTGCLQTVPSDVTIACQTSPGGIMIVGGLFFNQGATKNVIMRHCRLARGVPTGPDNLLGIGSVTTTTSSILDHVSFHWSCDDMFAAPQAHASAIHNLTVQWSLFSESTECGTIQVAGRGGALVQGNAQSKVTFHHNLFANVWKRVPHFQGGSAQIVNNVIHNAQGGVAGGVEDVYLLANTGPILANIVNNWFQDGPTGRSTIGALGCDVPAAWNCSTPAARLTYRNASNMYLMGNVHTTLRPNPATGTETAMYVAGGTNGMPQGAINAGFPTITSTTAAIAAKTEVIAKAGALVPLRTPEDQRAANDVTQNTGRKCGSSVTNASCAVFPTFPAPAAPTDTDGDGIPDAWEVAHGLNPASAADGPTLDVSGYSHLELYLNELAGDGAAVTPTTGPLAYYKFEDDVTDSLGGFDGTAVAAPSYDASGYIDKAIHFNGSTQYVSVAHAAALNDVRTIMAWVKFDALDTTTANGEHLVTKGDWNGANSYSLTFYNSNLRCGIGAPFSTLLYPSSNFANGQWYHIACTAGASGHKLYVNGALVASNGTVPGSITNTAILAMGTLSVNPTVGFLDGALDEVRLSTAELTAGEIQSVAALPVFSSAQINDADTTHIYVTINPFGLTLVPSTAIQGFTATDNAAGIAITAAALKAGTTNTVQLTTGTLTAGHTYLVSYDPTVGNLTNSLGQETMAFSGKAVSNYLGAAPSAPTFTQVHCRSEALGRAEGVWQTAEDATAIPVQPGGDVIVRCAIGVTVQNQATGLTLAWYGDDSGTPPTDFADKYLIGTTSSGRVTIGRDLSGVRQPVGLLTQKLTLGGRTFVSAGQLRDSTAPEGVPLAGNAGTQWEVAAVFHMDASATAGQTTGLRLYIQGAAALDAYTVVPILTVRAPFGRQ